MLPHASLIRRLVAPALIVVGTSVLAPSAADAAPAKQRAPAPAAAVSLDGFDWFWRSLLSFVHEHSRNGLVASPNRTCGGSSSGVDSQPPPVPSPNSGITIDPDG